MVSGLAALLTWTFAPLLAFGVTHGFGEQWFTPSHLLSLLVVAVLWAGILDSAQQAFSWSGYDSIHPSFPLAVLVRDAMNNR